MPFQIIIDNIKVMITIVRTLNLFIEKKLVYVIVIEENETRYDLL